ncbi:MAG: helix-hairpin-helix domain-containing protein, partial [Polyangiaceae bacterium]|nr:helix-hairpin-helix domain-containing protein [Polyangiaceae bacterium]
VDPGLRTGCKCAAVDATGRFLDHTTIYPFKGEGDLERAKRDFLVFLARHRPQAIAVGNGTAGRETERFVRDCLKEATGLSCIVVLVSESGASIYSASDIAREEFPDLDLTVRGAISIARRLQDPLAELVKLDPKSIGVGQYQHDVHQSLLQRKLAQVVESCVNRVGVELNTASAPLLSYVAGLSKSIAQRIVAHREANGPFTDRATLLKVTGLGPKAFEQAAGFLRVRGAANPLDASAVHPERYTLVEKIAGDLGVGVEAMVGQADVVSRIDIKRYVGEGVGEPTLRDIVDELRRPGRDPRSDFEAPSFREDVNSLQDLTEGMLLEGVVTNVTNFGAFVDVGVHQDGLVHISQLSDKFVQHPSEAVKVGQKLKVRVLEVDLVRGRISLTARSDGAPAQRGGGGGGASRGND